MKKYKIKEKKIKLTGNTKFEGNSIEKEMEIATTTKKMPEQNVASVFYTQKKYGVLPETDIRTDRFEFAQKAQNAIAIDFKKKQKELEQSQAKDETTQKEG